MRYHIIYNGVLAAQHVTLAGAQAHAFRLIQAKQWDASKVEIRGTK